MGIESIFGLDCPEIFIVIASVFSVLLYFLPYLLCAQWKQEKSTLVFFANLLFGWTGIGWFAVLIWVLFSKFGATR